MFIQKNKVFEIVIHIVLYYKETGIRRLKLYFKIKDNPIYR